MFHIFYISYILSSFTYYSNIIKKKNRKRRRIYNFDPLFKKKGKKDDEIRNCIICYDNIEFKKLVILRCDHYYHKECIKKWLKIHMVCPICREDYNLSI